MASGPSPSMMSCWPGLMHEISCFTPEHVSLMLPVYTVTDVPAPMFPVATVGSGNTSNDASRISSHGDPQRE
jgi:hypothetical protein